MNWLLRGSVAHIPLLGKLRSLISVGKVLGFVAKQSSRLIIDTLCKLLRSFTRLLRLFVDWLPMGKVLQVGLVNNGIGCAN